MNNKKHIAALTVSITISGFQFSLADNMVKPAPNFVFIICEDISCNLHCYGDSIAQTPHLDQLARNGMLFTNAFSVAGVCAPSRSGIITGMYPVSIGTHHMRTRIKDNILPVKKYSPVIPAPIKCFTEHLRAAGYYCTNKGKRDYQFKVPITAYDDLGLNGSTWKNCPKGKPFFCTFNIFDTHESQIWKRANQRLEFHPDSMPTPPYFPDVYKIRRDIAQNYTNIKSMDKKVGEILDKLKKDNLLDHTFVIFISDHGGPLPRQKREINHTGLHVPLIIRFPGAKHAGSINTHLISFVDLAPTFLALAGIKIPSYMQGQAFLANNTYKPRKYIYGARDRMDTQYDQVRSVIGKRFVYIRNYHPEKPWIQHIEYRENMSTMKVLREMHQNNKLNKIQKKWFLPQKEKEELYDLKNDPFETVNLANNPDYKDTLIKFRKACDNWLSQTGDMGNIPELSMIQSMWPGLQQPLTDPPEFSIKNSNVQIISNTWGASIAYQIKNKDQPKPNPNEPNNWELYTQPLKIKKDQRIYALAIRIGFKQSPMQIFEP